MWVVLTKEWRGKPAGEKLQLADDHAQILIDSGTATKADGDPLAGAIEAAARKAGEKFAAAFNAMAEKYLKEFAAAASEFGKLAQAIMNALEQSSSVGRRKLRCWRLGNL
jgi:hypothetical protein